MKLTKKAAKTALVLVFILLVATLVSCGSKSASKGKAGSYTNEEYEKMTMDQLYELAKKEGGTITVYATTTDASTASKKFQKAYPDLSIEYISCDNNTVASKIEMECDTGNINADVAQVKDNSGEIFHELVAYDYLSIYRPESVISHIDPELYQYGLPLYANFNPWYYNTKMFPDGCPISSWWDIVDGYDTATHSYYDKNGVNHQKWAIFTKDITGPSYASLFAQMIVDADKMAAQYEAQYGKKLEYTYQNALNNAPGIMEFPLNNAGVELFYRFSQMKMTELNDGDGVVEAVDESLNGPSIGLTSASKLDNATISGMNIDWVTGLLPYTAFQACSYSYVVEGCDNPAGARLYILFCMGGDTGSEGCYASFDKIGAWSVRDDIEFAKSGRSLDSVVLTSPDFEEVYANYPNVTAYWKYWRSLAIDK